jgi:transposase InsO family protein
LALGALRMALKQRSWKAEGLIHHSDRGVQYASAEYTALLDNNEIQISMSRRGNPYDNARAERFMRKGRDRRDVTDPAPRPGTTSGVVNVPSVLPGTCGRLCPNAIYSPRRWNPCWRTSIPLRRRLR